MKIITPSTIALTFIFATISCQHPDVYQGCIQIPPTTQSIDKSKALKISAKLDALPVDASLDTSFKNVVNTEWGQLSDKVLEQLIYLRAIECFSSKGAPQQEIDMLYLILRQKAGVSYGEMALTGPLSPRARNEIKQSPLGNEVLRMYKIGGY
jgi:hypothetical protein